MRENRVVDEAAELCANILVANLRPVITAADLPAAHAKIRETVRAAMKVAFAAWSGRVSVFSRATTSRICLQLVGRAEWEAMMACFLMTLTFVVTTVGYAALACWAWSRLADNPAAIGALTTLFESLLQGSEAALEEDGEESDPE